MIKKVNKTTKNLFFKINLKSKPISLKILNAWHKTDIPEKDNKTLINNNLDWVEIPKTLSFFIPLVISKKPVTKPSIILGALKNSNKRGTEKTSRNIRKSSKNHNST